MMMKRFSVIRNTQYTLLLLVLLLMGCGGGETAANTHDTLLAQIPSLYSDNAPQADGTFVGAVADSNLLVGLVMQGESVVAYLCNGDDVGDWLRGTAVDGQLELSSSGGTTVTAVLANGVVTGEVTRGEHTYTFSANPAQNGTTGLYRHKADNITAGWIVLENGIVGTSSDGQGVTIRDNPVEKEEAGGSPGSPSGDGEKGEGEIVVLDVTPGAGDGQQATTLGEAPPPPCEATREGCGGSSANCDALRSEQAAAERAVGDLERELANNGVQNPRTHPAIAAAQRASANLSGQLRSSGCG